MESGLTMVVHAVVLAVAFYLVSCYVFHQSKAVAEDRSVLLGALTLAYMVLFGHGLPNRINPRIL